MERSLSVLLPVHNSQSTLVAQVEQILEILPDLTPNFELVIIDDGSSDATIEVADELAGRYPQVRAVRHGVPLGRPAAVQTGLQESSGEVVCLHDSGAGLPIDEVHKVWQALDRPARGGRQSGDSKGAARPHVLRPTAGGFQICSRDAILPGSRADTESPADPSTSGKPRRPKFAIRPEKRPHQEERS